MRTTTPPDTLEIVIHYDDGSFEFGRWDGRKYCTRNKYSSALPVVGWSTVEEAIALAKQRRAAYDAAS